MPLVLMSEGQRVVFRVPTPLESMKSRPSNPRPKSRSSNPRTPSPPEDSPELETIAGKDGAVAMAWLAPGVFYTRFQGGFTASMGHTYATRLNTLIAPVRSLSLFCDMAGLKYYDLLARSSLARVVLSNRRRFNSITMLVPKEEGIASQIGVLVAALGEPLVVLLHRNKFEAQIASKAPQGMRKIDPKSGYFALPSHSGSTRNAQPTRGR